MNDNINEKLNEIKLENFILIIYYILITLYYFANTIEVNYLKYHNEEDKEKYRMLLYIIFGSIFLISLYYSVRGISSLNNYKNSEVYKLESLSLMANLLALVATGIYLYVIYKDRDINLEVIP